MESEQLDRVRKEIAALVESYFEIGKSKDLTSLSRFFGPSRDFSKFDESPPYTRQSAEDAFVYEQAKFANISDYQFTIEELRVDALGNIAIATFYLTFKGVFVNDYAFEGSTVGGRSRVTMVFGRYGKEWRLVHEHASRFPSNEDRTF